MGNTINIMHFRTIIVAYALDLHVTVGDIKSACFIAVFLIVSNPLSPQVVVPMQVVDF